MARIANLELALWYLSLVLQMTVVYYLLTRKLLGLYRGLSAYLLVNILQSCALMPAYHYWGYYDVRTSRLAWISQILVLMMRAWAIADICRLLLARYLGIWGLAWRLLLSLATVLTLYSLFSAGREWDYAVLRASASLELTTVLVLVALFLFARHYGIAASPAVRALALGFLIYSSFTVLNHKVLEQMLEPYVAEWQLLSTLPFIVSVCLWLWAIRRPAEQTAAGLALLPREVYYALAPEINLRLRLLDERLSRLWNREAPHQ
jgi:hypothetical protein